MMKSGKSIVQLDKALRQTPEFAITDEIESFSRSIELFDGNYRELRDLLLFFEDVTRSFYLEQDGNDVERRRLLREIVRFMHNYVAAVMSLIEHSRIHYRKLYERNKLFPEYQEKVDAVFKFDLLSCFVKDLRQFFQHYALPGIYFQMNWTKATGMMERTVRIRLTDLEHFKWSSLGKQFLASQTEDIDLLKLTDAYYEKVTAFYQWFQGQQEELHTADFKKVSEAKMEMRRLALPDILNATLQFPDITAAQFEATILKFLDQDTLVVLALMELDSKAEFLCNVFKTMTDISSGLEERIKALYKIG
jgi:hypothetical protein